MPHSRLFRKSFFLPVWWVVLSAPAWYDECKKGGKPVFHGMEYVYTVWQERSFSMAARKLYISQPALSNSIKRIEEKVGAPLFDRSTSPIRLTDIGEAYIRTAGKILALEEDFSHYMSDVRDLKTGRMSLGAGAVISSFLLPPLLSRFKDRYPDIAVSVEECSEVQLKDLLAGGSIDLVLDNGSFPDATFGHVTLETEHLLLAVPRSWPINRSLLSCQQNVRNIVSGDYLHPMFPSVPLDRFQDSPFLMLEPGDNSSGRAAALCARYGFAPRTILTVSQQLTAFNMVCSGLGAAFISDTLVRNARLQDEVIFYKLDGEEVCRDICFFYKRNRYLPLCVRRFLQESTGTDPL